MTPDDHAPQVPPQPEEASPKPPMPPAPPPKSAPILPAGPPEMSDTVGRRDDELHPWLAALLSVIPCLGHLYARSPGRALALFVSWIVAITMLPFGLNIAAAAFLWFFGIFDAFREAQLTNLDDAAAARSARGSGGLALGVFLTVTGGLLLAHHVYGLSFEWLREWWPVVLILGGIYFIVDWLVAKTRSPSDVGERDPDDNI